MNKHIFSGIFFLLVIACSSTVALAQSPSSKSRQAAYSASSTEPNDQVSEMLDSLVSLKALTRYNLRKPNATYNAKGKADFQSDEAPTYNEELLRQRLAKMQSPIPFAYNDQVRTYIDLYLSRKRDLTAISLGLSHLYFPLFEQVLDKYDLPIELKYLAIVESGLNPTAVSHAGATGMWQFMHTTGKMYNLEINSYIDERRDVYKSTVAACQYFRDMYGIYKDWLLVIAAYNCGAGNVNKAIARSGGRTSFWEICKYLPKETRGYVPAFIAANYMMTYATEHNITAIPSSISFVELDTVQINKPLQLSKVASTLNIQPEMVKFLNPVYKKGFIPGNQNHSYKLILPANKVTAFINKTEELYNTNENLYQPPSQYPYNDAPAAATTTLANNPTTDNDNQYNSSDVYTFRDVKKWHLVRSGESMEDIAQHYNCSVEELRKWNKLKSASIRKGQRITVYITIKEKSKILTSTAQTNTSIAAADVKQANIIYHTVQRGDTLWNIARRYEGVTVEQLKDLNKITSSRELKPGKKIKVAIVA